MSAKKLTTLSTTNNSLSLSIKRYGNSNFSLAFKGSCSKQKNATYTHPNRIIFFIFCELDIWSRDWNSDFALKDSLFGGVELAKSADLDRYIYNTYVQNFHYLMVV